MSFKISTSFPSPLYMPGFYSPPSVENEQNGNNSQLSPNEFFADSTYLQIDDGAADRLSQLIVNIPVSTISSWLGHNPGYLSGKTHTISVKDARLINQNSKTNIFEIDEKDIIKFKVAGAARKNLQRLNETRPLKGAATELGFGANYITRIKNNETHSISKIKATKINEFFKSDVFCIHQIFDRSCTENIDREIKKQTLGNFDEFTYIAFDKQSQDKVKEFDSVTKTKISKFAGNIRHYNETISVRNAFIVNKVSESQIFEFSVEKITSLPVTNDCKDQFNKLIAKKIKNEKCSLRSISTGLGFTFSVFNSIRNGKQKTIYITLAKKINNYFNTKLFDLEKIMSQAQTDALHFYESLIGPLDTPSQEKEKISQTSKKRTSSGEEKTQPSLKKQKICSNDPPPVLIEIQKLPSSNTDVSNFAFPESTLDIVARQLLPRKETVYDNASSESDTFPTYKDETTQLRPSSLVDFDRYDYRTSNDSEFHFRSVSSNDPFYTDSPFFDG